MIVEARKPKRGRPLRSDRPDTRDRILEAALEVFSERGFDGATVRQIAAKVGVSDPALYAHFKGKLEIFEALLKLAGPNLLASADFDPMTDKAPMQIAIPKMFGNVVATLSTPRARAFASLVLRMGPDGLGHMLQDVSKRLRPIFDVWQARGELRDDVPVEVARSQATSISQWQVEQTELLSRRLHSGQVGKLGADFLQVYAVADVIRYLNSSLEIAGLRHDAIEDCDDDDFINLLTIGPLFGSELRDAVNCLTKRPGERYDPSPPLRGQR